MKKISYKKFFELLKEASKKYKFYITEWGAIRARRNKISKFEYCPITACTRLFGKHYKQFQEHLAGKEIGLSEEQIINIANAADFRTYSGKLRNSMLKVVGLNK